MEVKECITKLQTDMQAFKSFIRTMEADGQTSALDLLDTVIASDRLLQDAIVAEKERQLKIQAIEAGKERMAVLDKELVSVVDSLLEKMWSLEDSIKAHEEEVRQLRNGINNVQMLDPTTVLAVAENLTFTSGPPPNWKPGNSLRLHRPPYPTEDVMRASLLFRRMNMKEAPMTIDPLICLTWT